jgi:protein CpxP
MTTKRITLAVGAALLAVATAGAGLYAAGQNTNQAPPPFKGGRMGRMGGPGGPGGPMGLPPMMARQLNLTDAQKAQVKTIADSHRDEWKALGDRARAAHKALSGAITADTVDEGLIRQRSAELAAVQADLAVARAKAHAEVFQILTPEQKTKAQELRAQMEQRMQQRAQGRQGRQGRGPF